MEQVVIVKDLGVLHHILHQGVKHSDHGESRPDGAFVQVSPELEQNEVDTISC